MRARLIGAIATACFLCNSCAPRQEKARTLTVAAAANLSEVFQEAGRVFQQETGVAVVFSFGSTAQLAQQISNGAPFDLFAAADTAHIDSLVVSGRLLAESRAIYAIGQLALWSPKGGVKELRDLLKPTVRFVALAQPDSAPYGKAAVEALTQSGLWSGVKSKVVYSNSISQAKQQAASGNADAAFTAYSLVLHELGTVLKIDPGLHRAIEQALGIAALSKQTTDAQKFRAFLLTGNGRAILEKSGYLLPPAPK